MKTLVLTDLHLYDKPKGHLDAQVDKMIEIVMTSMANHGVTDLIIMGDIFMRRHPSPSELVAFKEFCIALEVAKFPCVLIRGNHDSENKSDDGVTCLSVYESKYVSVVRQTWCDQLTKRVFIPHYEDEVKIREALANVPSGYTVFGHFGYAGCMNSMGDHDFHLKLSDFKNKTYLGHIHGFSQRENVTILGTPWSTNFGEAGKTGYYMILDNGKEEFVRVVGGPCHMVMTMEKVENSVEILNDPLWYTQLRVQLEPGEGMGDLPDDLDVAHVDFKYKPTFDEENQSSWRPDSSLFQLNSQIIEDYVQGCVTSLDSSSIMQGYDLIKQGGDLPDED